MIEVKFLVGRPWRRDEVQILSLRQLSKKTLLFLVGRPWRRGEVQILSLRQLSKKNIVILSW